MSLLDSGASYRCSRDKSLFVKGTKRESKIRPIELADRITVEANETGTVKGKLATEYSHCPVTLKNVLFFPKLSINRKSVSTIQENGYYVMFHRKQYDTILRAIRSSLSYQVKFAPMDISYIAKDVKPISKLLWHAGLGHPAATVVDKLTSRQLITLPDEGIEVDTKNSHACITGKMTRRNFSGCEKPNLKQRLELVHSDSCGPMSVPSLGGAYHFLVLVDDATIFTYVAFLNKKSYTLKELEVCDFDLCSSVRRNSRVAYW